MALEKQAVVQTALALLDEVGSDGLTMRVLAKALNVQAPTLYWHFPSKQALLDQMADALIAPVMVRVDVQAEPDDVLGSVARALRSALLSRRDGARVYAGTYVMGENVLGVANAMLGALLRKGLEPRASTDAMFNLVYYVLGFCIEQQGFAARRIGETDASSLYPQLAEAARDRFPAVARCAEPLVSGNFDDRFEAGINLLLGGFDNR